MDDELLREESLREESLREEPLSEQGRTLLDADADRHDEAVMMLRKALAAGEYAAPGLLARAYLDRGYRHETIELLTPLVREGRHDLALPLGDALASVGDTDRAEDAYRYAISTGDASAMNTLGVFLRHRGRTKESALMLRRAAEAGDDMAPMNLVAVLWENPEQHEPLAARHAAEKWAEESRPSTLLGLAFIRAANGRYDEAERIYRLAAELGAYRGHIEYASFLQQAREDLAAAEAELAAAEADQEPGWALAYGLFLADVGRPEEARVYLDHAAYWGSIEARAALSELDGELDDD
jgi:Tfp pilus assembly protein PilF